MSTRHLSLLILLAAFWGASFLFIRVGVADFGVAPLMVLRVGFGALFLLVLALARNGAAGLARTLRRHAWPLLVCGLLNSAAPFCLFAFAELTLQAGITSVINATAPLWAAVVAYLWLGERLSMPRVFGLVVGFAGVLLVGNQVLAPEGSTGGASAGATALAA
ncbi:DMT family transporter, partial [Burkholderia sp. Cy-647]